MILGVDLSSNNPVFDFALAHSQGCRTAYVKLGGDNIARYASSSYAGRVDSAHAVGWPAGSYWITGGHDPESAAAFYCDHLRDFRGADYGVLDNEKLDDGNTYNDAEAAAWMRYTHRRVGGNPARLVHYGNKSLMESHEWPELLATGCSFLIADYNGTPLRGHLPSTIPANRVVGHQYADNGTLGGASAVDLNAFTDAFFNTITAGGDVVPIPVIKALENGEMRLITSTGKKLPVLAGPLGCIDVVDQTEIDACKVAFGTEQFNDVQVAALQKVVGRYVANAKLNLFK